MNPYITSIKQERMSKRLFILTAAATAAPLLILAWRRLHRPPELIEAPEAPITAPEPVIGGMRRHPNYKEELEVPGTARRGAWSHKDFGPEEECPHGITPARACTWCNGREKVDPTIAWDRPTLRPPSMSMDASTSSIAQMRREATARRLQSEERERNR